MKKQNTKRRLVDSITSYFTIFILYCLMFFVSLIPLFLIALEHSYGINITNFLLFWLFVNTFVLTFGLIPTINDLLKITRRLDK